MVGKTALDLISEIKSDSLPDRARMEDLMLRFQLLLAIGHASEVMEGLKLENIRKAMPPELYALHLLFAGRHRDYSAMDEAIVTLEKGARRARKIRRIGPRGAVRLALTTLAPPPVGSAVALAGPCAPLPILFRDFDNMRALLELQHNEVANLITLRGIFALESGNTALARAAFNAPSTPPARPTASPISLSLAATSNS